MRMIPVGMITNTSPLGGVLLYTTFEMASQFDQITSGEYVQQLDHRLRSLLVWLAKNRPYVRENQLARRYIRYFAKVLAEHLSYWLQKELISDPTQLSNYQRASGDYFDIIDRYFNTYLAFTLLEMRINGTLKASESILIVREPTRENHEITE